MRRERAYQSEDSRRGNSQRRIDDVPEAAECLCALGHRRPIGLEVVIHLLPDLEFYLRLLLMGDACEGANHVNQDLGLPYLDIDGGRPLRSVCMGEMRGLVLEFSPTNQLRNCATSARLTQSSASFVLMLS